MKVLIKDFVLLLVLTSYCSFCYSQGVAINNTGANPNGNAVLDVSDSGNDKGVLIPRISTAERTSIGGLGVGDEGLTVYDETNNSYWLWDGSQWIQFIGSNSVDNGLSHDVATSKVRLGGPLVDNTSINVGNFQLEIDLDGNGEFTIEDNGTQVFQVRDNGITYFGDDVYWRDTDINGVNIAGLIDNGNSGRLIVYGNGGFVQHDINGMGIVTFNSLGYGNVDFRVEGDSDPSTFYVDASSNFVGIGTNLPSAKLDVSGEIRIRGGAPTLGDFLMATDAGGSSTWSNSGYGLVPIGSIVAWHKNATGGVGGIPSGWVECNGGTSNGISVPNLNGSTISSSSDASYGRFLRGHTTSGIFQNEQTNNLQYIHSDDVSSGGFTIGNLNNNGTSSFVRNSNYVSLVGGGDRLEFRLRGIETRTANMTVVWIMRVQ